LIKPYLLSSSGCGGIDAIIRLCAPDDTGVADTQQVLANRFPKV